MIPDTSTREKVVFALLQRLQREAEQEHMLAGLPQHRYRFVRHVAVRLGMLFIALGTSLQQGEPRSKQVLSDV